MSRRILGAGIALLALSLMVAPAGAVAPKHLPSDTEIIFTVNFQQILNSQLVKSQKEAEAKIKEMLKQSPEGENAMRYLKKAGFDVYRDLRNVTVAASGSGDPTSGVIIVEGNIDEAKFYAMAEEASLDAGKDKLQVKSSGARRYLSVTPPDEKKHAYISIVSPGVLVAASNENGMKDAWARAGSDSSAQLKKQVQDLLATVNDKQSISFVATGSALAKMLKDAPVPNAQKAAPVVETIDAITAAITIGKDIDFQLAVGMQDVATAKQLTQQAVIGLAVAKEMVKQKAMEDKRLEPAVEVMSTIRAAAEQNNIVVRGVITGENLEKLIKSFQANLGN